MRKSWTPPECSTGKRGFRTQGRALHTLALIHAGNEQAVVPSEGEPKGVYKCACGAWHLTSSTGGSTVAPPG